MYHSDYEAFASNPVWKEILSTVKEVKEGIIEDLKKLDPFNQATELARHQGRILMIDFLLALPGDIKREIELNLREQSKERGGTDE